MNQTARSQLASSAPTQIFESGDSSHVRTATEPCRVYRFTDFQISEPVPITSKTISDLVNRWGGDEARKGALGAARVRLAQKSSAITDQSIRAMRLRAGMSQTDLAKVLGTSQSHIARIEGGSVEPTLDTCRRLARAFNVDLNSIGQALPAHKSETE